MLGSRIQKIGKNMDNIIQVKPLGSVHDVELRFKFSLFAGFDGNCMGFRLVFFSETSGFKV
jgi:hypothetical protein